MIRDVLAVARMIKIEHSIFALPFAYIGLFLAADGWPGWEKFFWVSVAMVCIRSFAMTINRIVDRDIDAKNPRTSNRPLVVGDVGVGFAWGFALVCAILFVISCAMLNRVCLLLSVPVVVWAGLYSYSKRFTSLCHFWLGSVLALAPLGGWLGFRPVVVPGILDFFFGVLFWVAGFDIIYSCQDVDFDREEGLHSLPANLGEASSLYISTLSHVIAIIFFFLGGFSFSLGWIYFLSLLGVSLILMLEHILVTPDRTQHISLAFFNLNAIVACVLCAGVIMDLFL